MARLYRPEYGCQLEDFHFDELPEDAEFARYPAAAPVLLVTSQSLNRLWEMRPGRSEGTHCWMTWPGNTGSTTGHPKLCREEARVWALGELSDLSVSEGL